ncbi:TRAP transporter TatT component family protein [Myxococcota bacterium]
MLIELTVTPALLLGRRASVACGHLRGPRARAAWVACVLVWGSYGCGGAHQAAWDKPPLPSPPADVEQPVDQATLAEKAWENRSERSSLEQAIGAWEEMSEQTPNDPQTLAKLSRAYFLLAESFMTAGENSQSLAIYDKGITAGELAMLAVSEEFATQVRGGEPVEAALDAIPVAGQAALFWYAANLGRFIAADVTTAAMYQNRIHAVMQRVLELDPSFFQAAPHRFLGSFYAEVPAFLGGNLDKSREHFEAALTVAPDYLDTKVLYAELYAPRVEDRALFDRLLGEVVAADPSVIPGLEPEQHMAQSRARRLLDNPDELF